MSDLIEREYLLNIARKEEAYGYVSEHEILNAPTAEPKVGRWKLEYLTSTNGDPYAVHRCNLCEWAEPTLLRRNFCPNCGAKMEGETYG